MRRNGSLRRRIVAAYALLALAVCGLFAMVVYFTVQEIERHLVEQKLETLAAWRLASLQRGDAPELPPGLRFYAGRNIPADLLALPPGLRDVIQDGHAYHVFSGRSGEERFVAVEETGNVKKIEREVIFALLLGVGASAALALLLGRLTAGRVIAPVTALAEAVKNDALEEGTSVLELDDEIGILARTFAARTAELRKFLVRERLFTGDVSHELRTPLTVILGASEVLASRVADRPELAAAVERIQRTARDTADRVGALLLMSRSPETLDAPRTELAPLLQREVDRCRPLLVGKPVALSLVKEENVWVFARAELVGMAIGNVLRNACQYTEAGEIVARLAAGSLVIEDTGPGLPASVKAQLFERFVRGDSGDEGGAGLGLAIVKRITEHLGWEIALEDRSSGGSRFVLTFAAVPLGAGFA